MAISASHLNSTCPNLHARHLFYNMKYFIGKLINVGLNHVGRWGSQKNSTTISSSDCEWYVLLHFDITFLFLLLHVSFRYVFNIHHTGRTLKLPTTGQGPIGSEAALWRIAMVTIESFSIHVRYCDGRVAKFWIRELIKVYWGNFNEVYLP